MTKRRGRYKFTRKKKSLRGMAAIGMAAIAIVILVLAIMKSYSASGQGSVYLGSAGVLSILLGITGIVFGILAVREEETFKAIPYTGLVGSIIATVLWLAIYVIGFIL